MPRIITVIFGKGAALVVVAATLLAGCGSAPVARAGNSSGIQAGTGGGAKLHVETLEENGGGALAGVNWGRFHYPEYSYGPWQKTFVLPPVYLKAGSRELAIVGYWISNLVSVQPGGVVVYEENQGGASRLIEVLLATYNEPLPRGLPVAISEATLHPTPAQPLQLAKEWLTVNHHYLQLQSCTLTGGHRVLAFDRRTRFTFKLGWSGSEFKLLGYSYRVISNPQAGC